jgi:hypothetical protein
MTGTLEPATTPECVSRICIAVVDAQGAGSDERLDVEL